jgi:hypothetical protein
VPTLLLFPTVNRRAVRDPEKMQEEKMSAL